MSQVTALHRREMILLGAVPTGVTPVMLAVQYKVYVDESEATILVRTALQGDTGCLHCIDSENRHESTRSYDEGEKS